MTEKHEVEHEVEHEVGWTIVALTIFSLWCIGNWVDRYLDRAYPKPVPAEKTK